MEMESLQPSICIPRVDLETTDEYIRNVVNKVFRGQSNENIDPIAAIDLVSRKNERGDDYKRAFIHFINWDDIPYENAQEIRKKLIQGETIKIIHNFPNYWKCSASRFDRPSWL